MADVFISYSRKDIQFAQRIHQELEARDREPWVDWQDIPPTSEWLDEVYAGIQAADTFLFIISPDSVVSEICILEIEHAVQHGKRLVPVVWKGRGTLPILLNGKLTDPIFADGSKITLSVETNQNQGILHVFYLNDSGEIRFMNFIDVEKSSPIPELVIQHNTYGSTVNIYDNKLTKETLSPELEAIIVINADKRSLFEKNYPISTKQIITNFNTNSPNRWSVGQLGYQVH